MSHLEYDNGLREEIQLSYSVKYGSEGVHPTCAEYILNVYW